uniref:Pre-mRNA-splicing factor 38 n=1 Tax=Oryza nivara TaxID=4536 RepID=A0A0E0GX60_ORYNI
MVIVVYCLQTNKRKHNKRVILEKVLSVNILSSDYFKELYWLKTYHEVINMIYNQVIHVEPWMTGNCRGPSSDFCLLYKCFTMKLTVGFVYLRYVTEPKTLWSWATNEDPKLVFCFGGALSISHISLLLEPLNFML